MYATLWVAMGLCLRWLQRHNYHFKTDWNAAGLNRANIKAIFLRYLPFAAFLWLFTWLVIPEHLFSLPRERPLVWVLVMILYPLLSVVPQEIIFRSFFFRRYAPWLQSEKAMIIASALAFGWLHIILQNWVAITFSAFGGLLFADTYRKKHSLALVCFEHALYGCTLFTLGLGYYFYHGQAVR